MQAAPAAGQRAIVPLLPDPRRPDHVARITWEPAPVNPVPRRCHLDRRHVNRGPYYGRPLGAERVQLARSGEHPGAVRLVLVEATSRAGARFAAETLEATRAINEDREMSETSERWMRHSWRDIQTHRDGLTLKRSPWPPALRTMAMMLPPVSPATFKRGWLRATEEGLATSPLYGLIVVRDLDDRVGQLEAGRALAAAPPRIDPPGVGRTTAESMDGASRLRAPAPRDGTIRSRHGRGHRNAGGCPHLRLPPGLSCPVGAAQPPTAGGGRGPSDSA